nr:unnamed protein product [Callosobruchus analis]
MHRDDRLHQGKLKYEFQGPYEIMGITPEGRFETRRVGKSLVTKAAKEQLRSWPSDWSLTMDKEELLENLENDLVRFAHNYSVFKAWYALHVVILCLKLGMPYTQLFCA